ncbi:hypothetical protein [Sedimentitalea arenosa]|uniref:Uncharacterized protein n=1 Tax=Sedimentitalea arenosa TaxID=2798803 RepID=A0A8J7LS81_9RHOB|nr:hypothetical protein [Arenibacterium arenosum]MBJ6371664.1 hypothetical protein [Arenibacterium arenosum]
MMMTAVERTVIGAAGLLLPVALYPAEPTSAADHGKVSAKAPQPDGVGRVMV